MPHYKYKEKSHQRVSAHQAAAHQGPLESQQAASHGAHQAINHQDILKSQGVAANTRLLPLKQQLHSGTNKVRNSGLGPDPDLSAKSGPELVTRSGFFWDAPGMT